MREIKYRQPYFNRDGTFSHWHYWGWMSKGEFIGPLSMGHPVNDEFGLMFISQYDRNGKEIFENDIVDCRLSANGGIFIGNCRGTVKFEEFEYGIETTDGNWPFASWSCVMSCEVIGNVYESPELIE